MKKTPHYASYHAAIFNNKERQKTIYHSVRLINALKNNDNSIYALVGTGTSGILGALVAEKCDLEFLYVRRASESPHDYRRVCGNLAKGKFIFFDDLIDSGRTLVHCLTTIANEKATDPNTFNKVEMPTIACVVEYDTSNHKNPSVWRYTYGNCSSWEEDYHAAKRANLNLRGYSVNHFARDNKL